jgi:hypothetical protein
MNRRHVSAIIAVCMVVVAVALVLEFWPRAGSDLVRDCRKIWVHRTLVEGFAENTVTGLRRAYAMGARGVEIDVIFDEHRDGLFVISEEALRSGATPELELGTMLAAVPVGGQLWIDFWNLKELSGGAASSAIERLAAELALARLRDRVVVESTSARRLADLTARGVKGMLWVTVRRSRSQRIFDLARAAWDFHRSGASAVSMDYREYDDLVAWLFARVPIHLFTVNDATLLDALTKDTRVSVVLSDTLEPIRLACQ